MTRIPPTTDQLRDRIAEIVTEHALSAQKSQYDVSVCISAVAAGRQVIEGISRDLTPQEYAERVRAELASLQSGYNDTDGQYTNGRGVIGSLSGDVSRVLRELLEE